MVKMMIHVLLAGDHCNPSSAIESSQAAFDLNIFPWFFLEDEHRGLFTLGYLVYYHFPACLGFMLLEAQVARSCVLECSEELFFCCCIVSRF